MSVYIYVEMRCKVLSMITTSVQDSTFAYKSNYDTPSHAKKVRHIDALCTPPSKNVCSIVILPISNKKTLFIDLDETLVHSTFEYHEADYEIPVCT